MRTVISKLSLYLISDVSNKAIPFFVLPYMLNNVTQQEYGEYALGYLILQFVMAFCNSGLSSKLIMDISKDNNWEKTGFFSYVLIVFNGIVLFVLYGIYDIFFLDQKDLSGYIPLIILNGIFQTFQIINLSYFQSKQLIIKYALLQIIQTVAFFSILIFSIRNQRMGEFWHFLLFFNVIYFLFHFFISIRNGLFTVKLKIIDCQVNYKFSVFQLPHVMANWVRLGYDRVLLATGFSVAVVGGYSAVIQVAMILSVILTAFNKFWTPFFFRNIEHLQNSKSKIIIVGVFIVVLGVCVSIFGFVLSRWFFPEEYKDYFNYLPIVCLGYIFQGLYFLSVNYIHHYGKSGYLALSSAFSILSHILLAPLLMEYYGIIGLAISLMVSWFILFFVTLFIVIRLNLIRQELTL